MQSIQTLDPTLTPQWDRWLLSFSDYSIFHTSHWARVLMECYGHHPRYFVLFENNHPTAMAPVMEVKTLLTGKRGVSLPFSDFCEPLAASSEAFQTLYAHIMTHGRQNHWRFLSIRGGSSRFHSSAHCSRTLSSPSQTYAAHQLPLSLDSQTIFQRLRSSTRRNIAKAQQQGVQVTVDTDIESLRRYYELHCLTRQRHGAPPQPWSFFQSIHKHIIAADHGMTALALYQNQPIAGAVFMHFGQHALYKFGASDRAHQHLRPNNLILWTAMEWYCRNGMSHLHLGRTDLDNEGLLQFKNGWGAKPYPIHYYRHNLKGQQPHSPIHPFTHSPFLSFAHSPSISFPSTQCAFDPRTILRRLPLPILKLAGKLIYPHAA